MEENQKATTTIKLKTTFKQPANPHANGASQRPANAKTKPKATVISNKGTIKRLAIRATGAMVPKCHICKGVIPIHAAVDTDKAPDSHLGKNDNRFSIGAYKITIAATAAKES